MNSLKAVILAAGKGTRMGSDLPKVLHEIAGRPMVAYSVKAAQDAGAGAVCLIVGFGADEVMDETRELGVSYVLQEQQLGTGHAVKCAKEFIGREGETLILFGDTPMITGRTLNRLYEQHKRDQNGVTVLSTIVEDPSGYGRIIRDDAGNFVKSVEHKDATEAEKQSVEINSGMYIFKSGLLSDALDLITNQNAQQEYYLPDALTIIKNTTNERVDAMVAEDAVEIEGVNTLEQLAYARAVVESREED